jgi:hypothetical protein
MGKITEETKTPQPKPEEIESIPLDSGVENKELPNEYKERLNTLEKQNAELLKNSGTDLVGKAMKTESKAYFSTSSGNRQMCIPTFKDGKTISEFVQFKDGVFIADKPHQIAFLDNVMAKESHLPLNLKTIVTQEDYDSLITPDATTISYDGRMMNISEVREGLDFAVAKGWEPEWKTYVTKQGKPVINRGGNKVGNFS